MELFTLSTGQEKILNFKILEKTDKKKNQTGPLPKLMVRFKGIENAFDFEMLIDFPMAK